jgi:hypothetical protein
MTNDGGPAFPLKRDPELKQIGASTLGSTALPMTVWENRDELGMSLRDYFAAKAMEAEIITSCSDATPKAADDLANAAMLSGQTIIERIAYNAYRMADAMIKARAPQPNSAPADDPERERDDDDGRTYADPRDERDERARR